MLKVIRCFWKYLQNMVKLVIKKPKRVHLSLSKREFPRELRLEVRAQYNEVSLEINSEAKEYVHGFYVLYSEGTIYLGSKSGSVVQIAAELKKCWIRGGKPLSLTVYSKPLSRSDIHEIDEKLGTGDVKVSWNVEAYGFLAEKAAKEFDAGLIPIIVAEYEHHVSRSEFVKNVLEQADMMRREFLEVISEPIDLSYIKDARIRGALQLLLEKQKLLLGAIDGLKKAKTATDFRGIIDEVRRAVEGLERLRGLCEEIYKKLYIGSSDISAIDKASREMAEAVFQSLKATYTYASRFGIHTKTKNKKSFYTPVPRRIDAEFAVQQTLIELNYLARLLSIYALHT